MSENIQQKADAARKPLIPTKLSERYLKEMEIFSNWRQHNGVENIEENVCYDFLTTLVVLNAA